MNTRTFACIVSGIMVVLIFATNPLLWPTVLQAQEDEEDDESGEGESASSPAPSATVVNSKYLTLLGVMYDEEDNQVTIVGNVSNISPDQSFTNVVVVGQLYSADNTLITTATGTSGLTNLQPGQQSAFTITTNIPSEDEVTRYTVLPGGSSG
jgi:hypothetical protein